MASPSVLEFERELDSPLRRYTNELGLGNSTTDSVHGVRPPAVTHWAVFAQAASAYRFPNQSATHRPDFARPISYECQLSAQRGALTSHLMFRLRPVVDFFRQENAALNWSVRVTDLWLDPLGTKPDISCVKSYANGLKFPILLTEVKKPLVLPNTAKPLHIRYREHLDRRDRGVVTSPETCVVLPIQQIAGYMNRNRQKYGVLSTYDCTWFLRRDRSSLAISDPVLGTSTGGPSAPSFLRAYAYVLSLVLSNQGRGGYMEPFDPSQTLHLASSGETTTTIEGSSESEYFPSSSENNGSTNGSDGQPFLADYSTSLKIAGTDALRGTEVLIGNIRRRASAVFDELAAAAEGRTHPLQVVRGLASKLATTAQATAAEGRANPLQTAKNVATSLTSTALAFLAKPNVKIDPMTERFILENFEDVVWGSRLGQGLHGTVIACVWKGGAVAMKTVDRKFSSQVVALNHEAQIYEGLRSIQGKHIPQIFARVAYDGYQALGLVMERGAAVDWINPDERHAAKASLAALHKLGFAHGDVRDCNFVALPSVSWLSSARRIVCVDLALAKPNASSNELALEQQALRAFC
ncbi:hypothetical protein DFJ77DRAFT_257891 [Powellomyces hirtus]|nr:hypothetical protein DFJ77DRAFT_257891 [Powellomyces hirtus]